MILLLACAGNELDNQPEVLDVGLTDATSIRTTLDEGLVPDRDRWLEPGLFWSHELPLGDCQGTLCAQVGTALVTPLDGGEAQLLVVVDFAPEPVQATTNVVFAVDTSWSMGPQDQELVGESVRAALLDLSADDYGSLVTFDEEARVARRTRAMDTSERNAIVGGLAVEPSGGTAVEVGLAEALSVAASSADRAERSHVLLFTDQPLSDDDGPDSAIGLVRRHGVAGITTTLVGVGTGLGVEWPVERSVGARVERLDDTDERTLYERIPVATNLHVTLEPTDAWAVVDSWLLGGSTAEEPDFGAAWLGEVHPGGGRAVAFVLEPTGERVTALPSGQEIGALDLSWADGDDRLGVVPGEPTFSHTGLAADTLGSYRFAALLDEAVALEAAAAYCADGTLDATVRQALDRLDEAATTLDDEDEPLWREVYRLEDLADLLDEGAPCSSS